MADHKDELDQLGAFTKIVADTGDIESIKKYHPVDATTNPSLLLAAVKENKYGHLVDDAVTYALSKHGSDPSAAVDLAMDKLAVNFGAEITKIVPGVVSTEIDARLSFDMQSSINKARRIIELYKEVGVPKERILIKLASTWEGLQAAKTLEQEGIHCNMTLLFTKCQAVVAADIHATLISPFVGRITDWYKKAKGVAEYKPEEDPGVHSVREIYKYFKSHGVPTIVMGASFRNVGQILALAGCDKLTISPHLLEELKGRSGHVQRVLKPEEKFDVPRESYDEKSFRWALNEDQMATEKLSDGIRIFAQAARDLEHVVKSKLEHKVQTGRV